MGNKETKPEPTPSAFLKVESRALSSNDVEEHRVQKNFPRKLGTMLLSHWIFLKRREKKLVEKARKAVAAGKAPPSIIKEITQQVEKDLKRHQVRLPPKIPEVVPDKPTRLRVPRLTSTVAWRLHRSYLQRDLERPDTSSKESDSTMRACKMQASARSIAWSDKKRLGSSIDTQTSIIPSLYKKNNHRKKKPPSRDLSVRSVTTNESSGIGMSRASSMNSVASSVQRIFYSRKRISNVTTSDAFKGKLRSLGVYLRKETSKDSDGEKCYKPDKAVLHASKVKSSQPPRHTKLAVRKRKTSKPTASANPCKGVVGVKRIKQSQPPTPANTIKGALGNKRPKTSKFVSGTNTAKDSLLAKSVDNFPKLQTRRQGNKKKEIDTTLKTSPKIKLRIKSKFRQESSSRIEEQKFGEDKKAPQAATSKFNIHQRLRRRNSIKKPNRMLEFGPDSVAPSSIPSISIIPSKEEKGNSEEEVVDDTQDPTVDNKEKPEVQTQEEERSRPLTASIAVQKDELLSPQTRPKTASVAVQKDENVIVPNSRPQTASKAVQIDDTLNLLQQRRKLPSARGRELTQSFRKNLEEQEISRSRQTSRPSSVQPVDREPLHPSEFYQQESASEVHFQGLQYTEPQAQVTHEFSEIQRSEVLPSHNLDTEFSQSANFPVHHQLEREDTHFDDLDFPSSSSTQTMRQYRDPDQDPNIQWHTPSQSRRTTPIPRIHSCRKIEQSIEKRLREQEIQDEINRRASGYRRSSSRPPSQRQMRRSARPGSRRQSMQLGQAGDQASRPSQQLSRSQSLSSNLDQSHLHHPLNHQIQVSQLESEPIYQEIDPFPQQSQSSHNGISNTEIIKQQRAPSLNRELHRRYSDPLDERSSFDHAGNSPRHSQVMQMQHPSSRDIPVGSNVRSYHTNSRTVHDHQDSDHSYESLDFNDLQQFEQALSKHNGQPLSRQEKLLLGNSASQRGAGHGQSYRHRILESLPHISSRHYQDQRVQSSNRQPIPHHLKDRMKSHSVERLERRNDPLLIDRRNIIIPSRSIDLMNYPRQSSNYLDQGGNIRNSSVLSHSLNRYPVNFSRGPTALSIENLADRSIRHSRESLHLNAEENWENQRRNSLGQHLSYEDELALPLQFHDDIAPAEPRPKVIHVRPSRSRRSSGSKSRRRSSSRSKSSRKRSTDRVVTKHDCVTDERDMKENKRKSRKRMSNASTSTTLDHMEVLHPKAYVGEDHGQDFPSQSSNFLNPATTQGAFDYPNYRREPSFDQFEALSPRHGGQLSLTDAGTSMNYRYEPQVFAYVSPRLHRRSFGNHVQNPGFTRQSLSLLESRNAIQPLDRAGASMDHIDFMHALDASPRHIPAPIHLEPLQTSSTINTLENGAVIVHRDGSTSRIHSAVPVRGSRRKMSGRTLVIKKSARPSTVRSTRRFDVVEASDVGSHSRSRTHPEAFRSSSNYFPRAL